MRVGSRCRLRWGARRRCPASSTRRSRRPRPPALFGRRATHGAASARVVLLGEEAASRSWSAAESSFVQARRPVRRARHECPGRTSSSRRRARRARLSSTPQPTTTAAWLMAAAGPRTRGGSASRVSRRVLGLQRLHAAGPPPMGCCARARAASRARFRQPRRRADARGRRRWSRPASPAAPPRPRRPRGRGRAPQRGGRARPRLRRSANPAAARWIQRVLVMVAIFPVLRHSSPATSVSTDSR